MAPATSTVPQTSPIPAVYAVPVTVADGTTHLVGDDVYTVVMVMLGHRPYPALCGSLVRHASPTTRGIGSCERCVAVADEHGLRRSDRRVAGTPSVGPAQ